MLFLSTKLRKATKTSDIEVRHAQLLKKFNDFEVLNESQELKNFIELERYINSKKFKFKKKEVDSKKYKGSNAWRKGKDFFRLKNSKNFKVFFELQDSKEFHAFEMLRDSEEMAKYEELQSMENSSDLGKKSYSDELQEFKDLRESKLIKNHLKFLESKNYKLYQKIEKSPDLQKYEELKNYINTDEFKEAKILMLSGKASGKNKKSKRYKNSTVFKKEEAFLRLEKSKDIIFYFDFKKSEAFKTYEKVKDSAEIVRYNELYELSKLPDFNKKKKSGERRKFEAMRNSDNFKKYFKFLKSKPYKIYKKVADSSDLQKYYELNEYMNSEEFDEEKSFLLDKKRFEKTEEFAKLEEYNRLKSSEEFQNYFKSKALKNPFKELKLWELTFSEDFDGEELDREKWITRYYWGDKFIDDSYALPHENHYFTDGDNIEIANSIARLETRREHVQGKIWDFSLGFNFKDFDYTSALISTGKSFRQKYGRFEAKIKVNDPHIILNSFWMLSDKMLPHIDVVKMTEDNRLLIGNFWQKTNKSKSNISNIKAIDFSSDFFIYSLEWTAKKLIWRINDVVVKTQTKGVPQEAMYIILSSGVSSAGLNGTSVAAMEIDWVRCYRKPVTG